MGGKAKKDIKTPDKIMKKSNNMKFMTIIGIVISLIIIGNVLVYFLYPKGDVDSFIFELDKKLQTSSSEEETEKILTEFMKDPKWGPVCDQAEKELVNQREEMQRWIDSGNDVNNYPENNILPYLAHISTSCSYREQTP